MSIGMQPITVAIADPDRNRRTDCERYLINEPGIRLLENESSGIGKIRAHPVVERRLMPRDNIDASENEVARIKRLNPQVMLVNIDSFADEECALLLALRHACQKSLMVLMADESVRDNQIILALELGVKGYLRNDNVQSQIANAVRNVGRGEAWVPRKLLGNLMDYMLNQ